MNLKNVFLLALLSGAAVADGPEAIIMGPQGYWSVCELKPDSLGALCAVINDYEKDPANRAREPYVLRVRPIESESKSMDYTVSGTDRDGNAKIITGSVPVQPDDYSVIQLLSGLMPSVSITITETASVRTYVLSCEIKNAGLCRVTAQNISKRP